MLSKFRPKSVVLLMLFLVIKCKGSGIYGEIELGGYTDEIEVVGEEGIEGAPIYESMITGWPENSLGPLLGNYLE